MIPGKRLVVNDARALRQQLAVLGSAAEWAKESLFRSRIAQAGVYEMLVSPHG